MFLIAEVRSLVRSGLCKDLQPAYPAWMISVAAEGLCPLSACSACPAEVKHLQTPLRDVRGTAPLELGKVLTSLRVAVNLVPYMDREPLIDLAPALWRWCVNAINDRQFADLIPAI